MLDCFVIVKDKAGEFRARFENRGYTLFATEGYASVDDLLEVVDRIKKFAANAPVQDQTRNG